MTFTARYSSTCARARSTLGPSSTNVTLPRSRAQLCQRVVGRTEPHTDNSDIGRGELQRTERCGQFTPIDVHQHLTFTSGPALTHLRAQTTIRTRRLARRAREPARYRGRHVMTYGRVRPRARGGHPVAGGESAHRQPPKAAIARETLVVRQRTRRAAARFTHTHAATSSTWECRGRTPHLRSAAVTHGRCPATTGYFPHHTARAAARHGQACHGARHSQSPGALCRERSQQFVACPWADLDQTPELAASSTRNADRTMPCTPCRTAFSPPHAVASATA